MRRWRSIFSARSGSCLSRRGARRLVSTWSLVFPRRRTHGIGAAPEARSGPWGMGPLSRLNASWRCRPISKRCRGCCRCLFPTASNVSFASPAGIPHRRRTGLTIGWNTSTIGEPTRCSTKREHDRAVFRIAQFVEERPIKGLITSSWLYAVETKEEFSAPRLVARVLRKRECENPGRRPGAYGRRLPGRKRAAATIRPRETIVL